MNLPTIQTIQDSLEMLKEMQEKGDERLQKKPALPEEYRTIETKVFTVYGNNVKLHAAEKQYKGLKYSLESAGATYDPQSDSWYLNDEKLEQWLKTQDRFGWLKNETGKR